MSNSGLRYLTAVCIAWASLGLVVGAQTSKSFATEDRILSGMKVFYQQFLASCNTLTEADPEKSVAPSCQHSEGKSKLSIDFVSYQNPTNKKASGYPCDRDGSGCDLYLEICVSEIGKRSCSLVDATTGVLGESPSLSFSTDLGGVENPLMVDVSAKKQGVELSVTVWDFDSGRQSNDIVDEFHYNITISPGSVEQTVQISSPRRQDKSTLVIMVRTWCPASPPNTDASIANRIPCECISARNLTEIWRRTDRGGRWDRTTQCDPKEMREQGYPWFRFSGEAGTHLLDSCPEPHSCGSERGFWSNGTMPVSVGEVVRIEVSKATPIGGCNGYGSQVDVMRCSTKPHDFIYMYRPYHGWSDDCNVAFCGMN